MILIDELQTIRPPAMENLHTLHRGDHGCPILVVGIGLRGTDAMLLDDAIAAFDGSKHGGQTVVETAVARGVLARHRDGRVGFGIPSFETFLQEKLWERDARRLQRRSVSAPRDARRP